MNLQSHMSGQISRQVPNQGGLPQGQNGNFLQPTQMPNLAGGLGTGFGLPPRNPVNIESHEFLRMRQCMQNKIFHMLLQRQTSATNDVVKAIAKRLDEELWKMAGGKMEVYLDSQTFDARLGNVIKNINPRHAKPSSSVGTMIPTPGIQRVGNTNLMATSTMDTSTVSSSGMHGGSLSDGHERSSAGFSIGSGSNSSTIGARRMSGQMIPTPGFNNNGNSISQSRMNVETSNNGVGLSAVESTLAPPSQQQRQQISGQNSHIVHNLSSQMGAGSRSSLQQRSYGLMDGSVNGALGIIGNNVQLGNEPRTSEGLPGATRFGQQPFDRLQRSGMHGESYAVSNSDSFGSGNLYGALTSAGMIADTQNMNSMNLNSMSRANSSLVSNRMNLHGMQEVSQMKPEPVDQLDNMSFQSSLPPKAHQQFQQQPHQFKHQQKFAHKQLPQGQNQQRQHLLNNNDYGQSQLACDVVTQVKRGPGIEHQNEVSEQFQLSDFQMLHQQPLTLETRNDFNGLSVGALSESVQGQLHSRSQGWTQITENSNAQHVQENVYQTMPRQCEAQHNGLSSGTIAHQSTTGIPNSSDPSIVSTKYGNENRDPMYRNQQRWLLYLLHARSCTAPEGKCQDQNCFTAQELLRHIEDCKIPHCTYRFCLQTSALFRHYKQCNDKACPVCVFVKKFWQQKARPIAHLKSYSGVRTISEVLADADVSDLQPSLKRLKVNKSSQSVDPETESSAMSISAISEAHSSRDVQQKDNQRTDVCTTVKSEVMEMNVEVSDASGQGNLGISEKDQDIAEDIPKRRPADEPVMHDLMVSLPKQEHIKAEEEINQPKEKNATGMETVAGSKTGKSKSKGVSLIELFTPEQVREHIHGLRKWVGQSKAKAEKNQAMERSMTENSCQLCAVEKLAFEPPPMYCTPCGARIKRNAMYYTVAAGEARHYICIPCYNEARGDTIVVEGTTVPKARFEKKKNDEEIEEWWVQCDKCEAWQHQICALFNGRRNDGGQAEYTCPNCYIQEVGQGERKPLPQNAVLGAKDLPTTILSDHIEQRLFKKLKQERQERARFQGKSYDEVPGAEALVVRVVSSVDKKLEVKPHFLELFREENYTTEFPYKSKAILLFQKIEGVEVCLFGMYVQEFGTECQFPNQRRVYLSYLDSVKYFRPEVKTVTGEALRTFVYHEILIGYLEYCKKRGFTSCYIWACPPLKGEDYILYCHPEIQKTPKSDKLREWYLSMLRKAAKEKVVVECKNLYDHFFVQTGECRAKVTAARLPYFDGDYWPGAAEDLIFQMNQEEDGKKFNKKGSTKNTISKRALKATGHSDLSVNASKDLVLMHKLGETICPMKEDFIMVHLQHCCTHCCFLMVSGNRWVCSQCKNFQICDKCYEVEQNREERERHPINHKEKHTLYPVEITDVPADTKDKDDILESEFFDTRQAFLSLCQGNHYQYDTLRRAKHSSMMILYHLHNPTAPAFVTTCNVCHLDIETGQGWRCEVCPDYDVCNACYLRGVNHPHNLTNHPSIATRDAQNKEARQARVKQLRKMLDLLVHASRCRSMQCQYPNCRKVKSLFRHGIGCRVRIAGGCVPCKRMWGLLQIHARSCKESQCYVPRCRDLKEHWRRQQQQSDSRRRAAVMEMMRQRAAEVASTSR